VTGGDQILERSLNDGRIVLAVDDDQIPDGFSPWEGCRVRLLGNST
jgi:hypothetical protein